MNVTNELDGSECQKKTFGFRNHSHALGSTVRHFQTLIEMPRPPKKGKRLDVGSMMSTLKSDPRAMDIFLDELATADQTQPKHMRFLSNLPSTTNKLLDSPAASRNKFNTTHTTNMSFDQSRVSQQKASKRDALIKTGYNSDFKRALLPLN